MIQACSETIALARLDGADEHVIVVCDVKSQRFVEPDGGSIVASDVEHAPAQSMLREVGEPGDGECPAEPLAVVRRVDTDYIDLADRRRGAIGRFTVVVAAGVHLRPTETGDTTINLVDEETIRIKPWLGHACDEHFAIPVTLLRMSGERPRVHGEPFLVIDTRSEWARCESFRNDVPSGERQRAPHVEEWRTLLEAVCRGERSFFRR